MDPYLVHADTGQPASPEVAEAAERAERIRRGITIWAATLADIAAAYTARDWATLGYESWETYVAGEFGADRVRLDRDQRREIVASLRAEHLSTRAIAAVVGADQKTVVNDLRATEETSSVADTVISIDGRTRPATRPPTPRPVDTAESVADPATHHDPSEADDAGSDTPTGLWDKPFEWPDEETEASSAPGPTSTGVPSPGALGWSATVLDYLAADQESTRTQQLAAHAFRRGDQVDQQFQEQIRALRHGAAACRQLANQPTSRPAAGVSGR